MKFNKLLFGPAGFGGSDLIKIPTSSSNPTSDAIPSIKKAGLDTLEIEFVHSVYLKNSTKEKLDDIKNNSKKFDFPLSIHAPYFINLNAKEEIKLQNSYRYILDSLEVAEKIGARVLVFHIGFFLKDEPNQVMKRIEKELLYLQDKFKGDVLLGTELVGKKTQIGSLEEILSLYDKLDHKFILPVIDFAHLHARENGFFKLQKNLDNTFEILKSYPDVVSRMHIHLSGINYTEKGERNHLMLKDSDIPYKKILERLKDINAKGTLICESPDPVSDALLLKRTWERL